MIIHAALCECLLCVRHGAKYSELLVESQLCENDQMIVPILQIGNLRQKDKFSYGSTAGDPEIQT